MLDREGLVQALAQFLMFNIEPLLSKAVDRRMKQVLSAILYAGYTAHYGTNTEEIEAQHQRRLDRSLRRAQEILEKT